MIDRTCQHCGKHFSVKPVAVKRGGGKYCSIPCYAADRKRDMVDRFWEKVDKSAGPDGCWIWTRSMKDGYGKIGLPGKNGGWASAHRYSWELAHGPIQRGMLVCHKCDNPKCVNPAHLFLGTPADNLRDMYQKGRQPDYSDGSRRGERNGRAKLTEETVIAIRKAVANGETYKDVACRYGISNDRVSSVATRATWRHI